MENENRFVTQRFKLTDTAVVKFAAQDASLVQQMQFGEKAWLETGCGNHPHCVRRILAYAYVMPRS